MKKILNWSIVPLIVLVFLVGLTYRPDQAESSIIVGNEYNSTTTRNYIGVAVTNLAVLKNGAGSLGSVVITGAAAGQVNLYDATSTVTNTLWATTTLATFPLSAAAGTYTFDVTFSKGLLIEVIGATPSSTITWR